MEELTIDRCGILFQCRSLAPLLFAKDVIFHSASFRNSPSQQHNAGLSRRQSIDLIVIQKHYDIEANN